MSVTKPSEAQEDDDQLEFLPLKECLRTAATYDPTVDYTKVFVSLLRHAEQQESQAASTSSS